MKTKIFFLVSGLIMKFSWASFINLETTLDPEWENQNQVTFNRKSRFIKFDTKDNELEIELGVSIPFVRVPLNTGRNLSDDKDSNIAVSVPGVIIAGTLMLTSILVVPFLFTTTPEPGFGFQRQEKRDVWSLMEGVNDVLSRSGIDSSSCMQRSICWITKSSKGGKDGSIGKWVNYFLQTWWLSRLIGGTFVEEAVKAGSNEASCGATYSHCSLTGTKLQSFVKMVADGHY